MFTGLVETTGQLTAIVPMGGDRRLHIASDTLNFSDVALGDSIASNGICLTVVALSGNSYAVDVSRETLEKTALTHWRIGDTLNLEKAMKPTTRFGGHMVSGHIDGVGIITKKQQDARSIYVQIQLPNELLRYAANKGSICVDGISLTINALSNNAVIDLNIIPHTAAQTNIAKHWFVGTRVNIGVDLIARYLERLLLSEHALVQHLSASTTSGNTSVLSGITEDFLRQNGFG